MKFKDDWTFPTVAMEEDPPPSIECQLAAMDWLEFLEAQPFPAPYEAEAAGFVEGVMKNMWRLSPTEILLGYEPLLPDESSDGSISKSFLKAFEDTKDQLRVSIWNVVTRRRHVIFKGACENVTPTNTNTAFGTIVALIGMFPDDASTTVFQMIAMDAMRGMTDAAARKALRDLMRRVCSAVDAWKSFYEALDTLYVDTLYSMDALVESKSISDKIKNLMCVTSHDINKITILVPRVCQHDWEFPIGKHVSYELRCGDVWKNLVKFDSYKHLKNIIRAHVPKPHKKQRKKS